MIRKEWKIPFERKIPPKELLEGGCTPLLASVLALRGVKTCAEMDELLHGGEELLEDPMRLTDMPRAVERVRLAVERKEKVAVYGDYDVDGITSTCLLTDYLRFKGLDCIPYIPDRSEEGYGLNDAAIAALHEQGVALIITVDCGITAREETLYAASLGMDMIITDHHECGSGPLPEAVAVVDCKRPDENYPNRSLAGVGVALKLVCACEGPVGDMVERYCDLAAIGTIADVMPLVGENRYLTRRGLEKIRSAPRPGIAAMLRESSVDGKKLTASVVGFTLAPRLNAAGRLDCPAVAARLLMTDDPAEATALAVELCDLNRRRQSIETAIWDEANAMLASSAPDAPIVLASDKWHQGVIGIAASRLAEQYSLPAIMVCLNGEVGKGSCRSYGGFNLFDALSACSEHLIGFGGHALAAGLSIRSDKLTDFRAALAQYYRENKPAPVPEVQPDLLICDPALLDIDNVRSLDLLEPFGNANPRPTMCLCGVPLESAGEVGGGKHLRIRARLGREIFEGIFFSHTARELEIRSGDLVDIAFTPQINDFRGHVSVQLLVSALRRHDAGALCEKILDGDRAVLWAAAAFCPERSDFVRVWHMAEQEDFRLPEDTDEILALTPPGMEEETFCLCLAVLCEVGLLSSPRGGIRGGTVAQIDGKADLDGAAIMRELRSY
ncbi:MAG: single-stranded-DNA-specific exonuclease RecJ [Oscillospiraceae bacterium]|nr:single-stranded-DNA-specific exonuclease RecJ [Oscillospiraceae bacterium]